MDGLKFKKYRRKQIAELTNVTDDMEIFYETFGFLQSVEEDREHIENNVSISDEDLKNGSPKVGDMIARNPKNHNDQWLVAKEYFEDNFEPLND